MRLLLDTHALLWSLLDRPLLPERTSALLADTNVDKCFSPVNVYEIGWKVRFGKLDLPRQLINGIASSLASLGLSELPVAAAHAELATKLAFDHRDPFDRLIVAQALSEDIELASNETLFDQTGVRRIWN